MSEKYDWAQYSDRVHHQAEADAAVRREQYRGAPREYVDPFAASEPEADDWGHEGPYPVGESEPNPFGGQSIYGGVLDEMDDDGPEQSPVARAFGAYMTGVLTGVFVPLAFMAAIPLGCIVLCLSFIAVMSVYAIRDGRGMS